MFRVSFFVEDKQLAAVLHQIAGAGPKGLEVTPVANLEAKPNGELKVTSRSRLDGFIQALRASGATINPESARAAATQSGSSASSYVYFLQQATKAGLIKKKGRGTSTTYAWAAS